MSGRPSLAYGVGTGARSKPGDSHKRGGQQKVPGKPSHLRFSFLICASSGDGDLRKSPFSIYRERFLRQAQKQSLCSGLGAGGPATQGIALRYS